MLEFIQDGGPIMIPLLLVSLLALSVFFERLFHLHRAQIKSEDFLRGIYNVLRRGNVVEAISLCDEAPGPVAYVARAAIMRYDAAPGERAEAVRAAGLAEVPRLERGLGWLATLAQTAPLLGLLGTVLGLMRLVIGLEQGAPLVHVGNLAGGYWAALASTAFGLIIAIPAYAGYNLLVDRVESLLLDLERAANDILAFLDQNPPPAAGAAPHGQPTV